MRITILLITSIVFTLAVSAHAQPEEVEFEIPMRAEWDWISAPVIPENSDMEAIFSEIVERENLHLCKNEEGQFYAPNWDYNNIPNWDYHRGYWVFLAEDDTLIITGEQVDPETPIQLRRGWNIVAFFPEHTMGYLEAFSGIRRWLSVIIGRHGDIIIPTNGYPVDLGIYPGDGTYLKVAADCELVYPQE